MKELKPINQLYIDKSSGKYMGILDKNQGIYQALMYAEANL